MWNTSAGCCSGTSRRRSGRDMKQWCARKRRGCAGSWTTRRATLKRSSRTCNRSFMIATCTPLGPRVRVTQITRFGSTVTRGVATVTVSWSPPWASSSRATLDSGRDKRFGIGDADSGFRIQDSGFRIHDSRFTMRDSGSGIRDQGFIPRASRRSASGQSARRCRRGCS
jgi:hypothetical protein